MQRSLLSLVLLCSVPAFWVEAPTPQNLTKAGFERMMKEPSNWGRWGKSDQIGTVNLITPAKRKAAAALVTEGYSVSLSRDTDTQQAVDNGSPFIHKMNPGVDNEFNMDEYSISFHGFAHTHMDALSHVFYQGQMYNGFPESLVKAAEPSFLQLLRIGRGFSREAFWWTSPGSGMFRTWKLPM